MAIRRRLEYHKKVDAAPCFYGNLTKLTSPNGFNSKVKLKLKGLTVKCTTLTSVSKCEKILAVLKFKNIS